MRLHQGIATRQRLELVGRADEGLSAHLRQQRRDARRILGRAIEAGSHCRTAQGQFG